MFQVERYCCLIKLCSTRVYLHRSKSVPVATRRFAQTPICPINLLSICFINSWTKLLIQQNKNVNTFPKNFLSKLIMHRRTSTGAWTFHNPFPMRKKFTTLWDEKMKHAPVLQIDISLNNHVWNFTLFSNTVYVQ